MTVPKRVLIVDDDKTVCALIGKVMQRYGADVTAVADGKAAKEALRGGGRFDAVFLDLIIPQLSGWDVLAALRADPKNSGIPVVILSGTQLSYQEKSRLAKDVVAFVDKETFDLANFDALVADVLSGKAIDGTGAGRCQ